MAQVRPNLRLQNQVLASLGWGRDGARMGVGMGGRDRGPEGGGDRGRDGARAGSGEALGAGGESWENGRSRARMGGPGQGLGAKAPRPWWAQGHCRKGKPKGKQS